MPTDIERIKGGLKACTFDIETTALEAQNGYMLCACIKEVSADNLVGKTWTYRIDDNKKASLEFNDKPLVKDVIAKLNEFDLVVGWYSSRFDFPFLNTRALGHHLMPPVKKFRRDLCLSARSFGKLKNNRLATWDRYLNGKTEKTFLEWSTWLRAMRGDTKALDYITHHCVKDVLITEKVYKRVMPLLSQKLRKGG